jgi:hypothetical protein
MLALSCRLSLPVTLLAAAAGGGARAGAEIVYDDFTTYNASVWEYADHLMGTTVRADALLRQRSLPAQIGPTQQASGRAAPVSV